MLSAGLSITNTYGDMNERFYSSMETVYVSACEFIVKNNQEGSFQVRAHNMVIETSRCGWGFHDAIVETYYDYFDSSDEE